MVEPAPKVEAAKASPAKKASAVKAKPCTVPDDKPIIPPAPAVGPAFAEPPTERGSLMESAEKSATATAEQSQKKLGVEELRATQRVLFESPAAVIVGPVEKDICQKMIPCLWFDERSFISFGEVKRHILIVGSNIFVYVDFTDPSPLYTIPLLDLVPKREDPNNPDFYSHTISPEANTGLPFANRSKESLETVLLKDRNGNIAFQLAFDTNEAGIDVLDKFVAAVISTKNNGGKL
mmetsp:Transcript_25303/g.45589  ORF Transcript_25303/g.45589 Transcript_25303/m.45589 type:complete len:236 (-) Transcript_25303:102-809(-)